MCTEVDRVKHLKIGNLWWWPELGVLWYQRKQNYISFVYQFKHALFAFPNSNINANFCAIWGVRHCIVRTSDWLIITDGDWGASFLFFLINLASKYLWLLPLKHWVWHINGFEHGKSIRLMTIIVALWNTYLDKMLKEFLNK